jgi:hypothetical protein
MIKFRGSGHVEFVVSRVRVWHPEFGYVGTSSASRLFMAFVVCGLFAGAISVAIFNPEPDHDPMDAMALAPEALIAPKPDQLATQSEIRPVTNEPSAKKTDEKGANASRKEGWIKPTCRENLGEVPEGDCTPFRVVRVRPVRAVNERPLIAAVPIGHRDDATALPASPPALIAVSPSLAVPPEEPKAISAPTEISVVEAPDAAPDAGPTPPASMPTVKKPRARVKPAQTEARARRRNHYSYASSYSARSSSYSMSNTYVQGGYARVW